MEIKKFYEILNDFKTISVGLCTNNIDEVKQGVKGSVVCLVDLLESWGMNRNEAFLFVKDYKGEGLFKYSPKRWEGMTSQERNRSFLYVHRLACKLGVSYEHDDQDEAFCAIVELVQFFNCFGRYFNLTPKSILGAQAENI